MAVVQDSLNRGPTSRLLNLLGDVKLRDDVLVDCSIGADNIDGEVFPGHSELPAGEARGFVPFFEGKNFVFQLPVCIWCTTRAALVLKIQSWQRYFTASIHLEWLCMLNKNGAEKEMVE